MQAHPNLVTAYEDRFLLVRVVLSQLRLNRACTVTSHASCEFAKQGPTIPVVSSFLPRVGCTLTCFPVRLTSTRAWQELYRSKLFKNLRAAPITTTSLCSLVHVWRR
jgi:hypothetical protein